MKLEHAASCLAQLGHPTRLAIFRLLIKAGRSGLPVGELQRSLGIPSSTLSHHILYLIGAGLIHQQRKGRMLMCHPSFETINAVLDYLTKECCEMTDSCSPAESKENGEKEYTPLGEAG